MKRYRDSAKTYCVAPLQQGAVWLSAYLGRFWSLVTTRLAHRQIVKIFPSLPALLFSLPVWAATPAQIEYVLQQILAAEEALFVDYRISDSGKVIVLFGANEPDWRIDKTIKALQSHPDISDLIWIKTDTDFCPIR